MQPPQLESLVEHYDLSDLAIAINQNDTEIVSACYGHCDARRTQPISVDTLFGIASVSKLVTAITILILQDRGKLSLFDSVNKYYPTLLAASNANLKLHHLLSHTSGWPGMASRFHAMNLAAPNDTSGGTTNSGNLYQGNTFRLCNTDDLVVFMNSQHITPLAEPGQLLNYCNEGFCLLGGIIEKITGCSLQQTVEHEVFGPLGMVHSTIGLPDSDHFNSIAQPIVIVNMQRSTTGTWDAPLFYPAGGVVASVRDLLKLMTVLSPNGPLLESASRTQLLTPTISVASRDEQIFGYSLGLEYRQVESGLIMHWHTGQRAGVSSLIATLPNKELSVAMLSNSSDAPLTVIAHQLIANLVEDSGLHWPPTTSKSERQTQALDLCGQYGTDEGLCYRVKQREGRLFLCHGANTNGQMLHFQTPTSGYTGQQSFAFLSDNNSQYQATKPHHNRHSNNNPWAIALDLRVLPRLS